MGGLPAQKRDLFLQALAGVVTGFILALFLLWTAVSYMLSSEIVIGRLILTVTGLLILATRYWWSLLPLLLAEAFLAYQLSLRPSYWDPVHAFKLGLAVGIPCTIFTGIVFSTYWFAS